jgi:putative CRISPR-associated protein (TIGR02619 family)
MPQVIISTVGQSILVNLAREDIQMLRQVNVTPDDIKAIVTHTHDFIGHNVYQSVIAQLSARADEEAFIRRSCAELNSLDRIVDKNTVDRNTQFHFFVSQTVDGAVAGRIIADFCETYFGSRGIVHVIEGLQVSDARDFRLHGLSEVIRTTYKILNSAPAGTYTRIINPTGGFKATIPYLTIIGMLEPDVEMQYIYERSEEIIGLGRLPVRIDFESIDPFYDEINLIDTLGRDVECTEAKLREILDWNQPIASHPIWSLLEVTDIDDTLYFTLSGLGEIALQHFKSISNKRKVFISQQVQDKLNSSNLQNPSIYKKYLDQLTLDQWYETHQHADYKCPAKATAIKIRRTNERVWCYKEGDEIFVIELTYHRNDGSYDTIPQNPNDYERVAEWIPE